jgi:hypothetical protein
VGRADLDARCLSPHSPGSSARRAIDPETGRRWFILVIEEMVAVQEYEAPEVMTYSEDEILQDIVVNCGGFSF